MAYTILNVNLQNSGKTAEVQLWAVSWKASHREGSICSIMLNQGVPQRNYLLEAVRLNLSGNKICHGYS